jgi:predicted DNA-binding protein (MmcQ/YjbR family)
MSATDEAPTLHAHATLVCMRFPEAAEIETWGHPTYRVRNKIFASFGLEGDDAASMTMKAPPGEQELLLATGDPFFYPRYVGANGWIGIRVSDKTDWDEIAELVEESYRMTAPKKLQSLLDMEPA